ncbi:MAG: Fructose-bisphosphate aldolase, class [Parcubacteria group bacterium]|nr:Fructose-bisphosphate aldolase, class [Parcubacteria group bacterium]
MIDLQDVAHTLLRSGKGILADDETDVHADKWLAAHGIEGGEEMRRKFRNLFLAAPDNEKYLSGVILFEGTLTQKADDGTLFTELLAKKGILPGIKVDQGLEPFPEGGKETITKGLIGLPERLMEFRAKYGTGFAKWRAAITIEGTQLPTAQAIHENAKRLALYALEVQKAGMVPIVEPEVLLEGNHSRLRAREVVAETISAVISSLEDQGVDITGVILKTSMVLSGNKSGKMDTPEEVAEDTVGVLLENAPKDLAGIVFLSGGQSTEQATANLRAIEALAKEKNAPWPLTFSYARALQDEALTIWQGKDENIPAAREAFITRLKEDACFTLADSAC